MNSNYKKFAEQFGKLTPYELDHFCEVWLCKLELLVEGKLIEENSGKSLNEQSLKFTMVEAMKEIILQLNHQKIAHQKLKMNQTMHEMFVNNPMVA